MGITSYVKKAFSMPPGMLFRKAAARVLPGWNQFKRKRHDLRHTTYICETPFKNNSFDLNLPDITISAEQLVPHSEWIAGTTENYLAHRFDLLGSGWTCVAHGIRCRGFEGSRYDSGCAVDTKTGDSRFRDRINKSNSAESHRIWSLIGNDYDHIDWHIDFKSGRRWSEAAWYRNIWYGHKRGVDVKVPWELARMQHLPHLAYAFILAAGGTDGFDEPARYVHEFRNQVLDFVAGNPPRFGVNWTCTMDVAIRVSNWIMARALFESGGADFDSDFISVFNRSVYEHGVHIINNLEWNPELRGNHYLSDIAGLIFVSAALPCVPETNAWLAFGVQELISETEKQFFRDGGNFECSTAYHRLSAELVAYSAAVILGLPPEKIDALCEYDNKLHKTLPPLKPAPIKLYDIPGLNMTSPLPRRFLDRMHRMATFSIDITKPCGHIPQFGDNDSGRFFKFNPIYNKMAVSDARGLYGNLCDYKELDDDAVYWDENHIDHRSTVSAINGFFLDRRFSAFTGSNILDEIVIRELAGFSPGQSLPRADICNRHIIATSEHTPETCNNILESLPDNKKNTIEIELPGVSSAGEIVLTQYPEFGLYIFRNEVMFLAVRCGPIGQNGFGGHAHNDQLAIELQLAGKDIIVDPGTYIYTPVPEIRNKYRSVRAHFAPRPVNAKEPGRLDLGLFRLGDEAKAECLYADDHTFAGRHFGFGSPVYRMIKITQEKLIITDWIESDDDTEAIELLTVDKHASAVNELGFSPAYGVKYTKTNASSLFGVDREM